MVEVELCHDEADLEIPSDFVKGEEIICQVGRFDGNSPFPIKTYSMIFVRLFCYISQEISLS